MAKSFEDISWEAEEYILKDHNTWWYVGLIVITTIASIVSVIFQDWPFLCLVILSAITLVLYSVRPPRKMNYSLTKDGLIENSHLKKYEEFRAFGILKEGTHFSAILIPRKRFGLQTKVYFPENSGEAIVDALGARLPMEEVKLDLLDKLINFLRI